MKSVVLIKIICTDALPRLKLPIAAIAPVRQDMKGLWKFSLSVGSAVRGVQREGPSAVSTDPGADLLPCSRAG